MVGSLANTVKNTLLSLDLGIGKVGVNDPSKWTSKTTDDPNVSLAYNQETGQVILVQKGENGNTVSLIENKPDGDTFSGTTFGSGNPFAGSINFAKDKLLGLVPNLWGQVSNVIMPSASAAVIPPSNSITNPVTSTSEGGSLEEAGLSTDEIARIKNSKLYIEDNNGKTKFFALREEGYGE